MSTLGFLNQNVIKLTVYRLNGLLHFKTSMMDRAVSYVSSTAVSLHLMILKKKIYLPVDY